MIQMGFHGWRAPRFGVDGQMLAGRQCADILVGGEGLEPPTPSV